MEYPRYKVCCRCFTFNQAKYITDAMNGFTMQQTSFPFVCTIVDDASTDGEQEVIRKYVEENFDFSDGSVAFIKETDYAHIAYAQHKTNKNCYFAVLYLKENHYSQHKPKMGYLSEWRDMCEYEALCEGDDYWIDPLKLQKQVDLLDSHEDMSFCCTANYRRTPEGKNIENHYKSSDDYNCSVEWYIEQLSDTIDTCTIMSRISKIADIPDWYYRVGVGDIPFKLILFERGSVGYINGITACYRLNAASSWTRSMATSWSKRWNNHKRILNMWNDFDEWTSRKYHNLICVKRKRIKIRYVKSELVFLFKKVYRRGN